MAESAVPSSPSLAPELADHVSFLLSRALNRMLGAFAPVFVEHGLAGRDFGILLVLARRGALRQIDIAEILRADRTTVMHGVDALQAAKLIRRHPFPGDRRAHAVTITAAGEKLIQRMVPPLAAAEDRFLAPLAVRERRQLLSLLTRLVCA